MIDKATDNSTNDTMAPSLLSVWASDYNKENIPPGLFATNKKAKVCFKKKIFTMEQIIESMSPIKLKPEECLEEQELQRIERSFQN